MGENSNKTIDDVRAHLFAVLDGLADEEKPMELDRAKAICDAAQTIINSAKVEVDFLKMGGHSSSEFIGPAKQLPPGVTGVRTHRIK
jgi:hypothetical protein